MVLKRQLLSLLSVIMQNNNKYHNSISTEVIENNKLRRLNTSCPEKGEILHIIHLL